MRAIPREVNDALVGDADHAYALGLWCADGYWWSSSIGISNIEPDLVLRFADFLSVTLSPDRLKLRIYKVDGDEPDPRVMALTSAISIRPASKMKRTAYHLYVNSRPLVRSFFAAKGRLAELPEEYGGPYFAGRFDGDGSWGTTPRIAYTTKSEAMTDSRILTRAGVVTSVLHYRKASEFCVYIQKSSWERFLQLIRPFSWKVDRRFTL
jgi:hypothetical protein